MSRLRTKIGGSITFSPESGIVIEGGSHYTLPQPFTLDFANTWVATAPGDEFFIGELMHEVAPADKRGFSAFCRSAGGDLWRAYCRHAVNWPAVLNGDNTWHLETMEIAYERQLGFPWIDKIYVTAASFRLLASPVGIISFEEFRYRYGQRVKDYILRYRADVLQIVDDVLLHGFSPLKRVKVSVIDSQGHASYRTIVGPETLPMVFWKIPEGCTLLTRE